MRKTRRITTRSNGTNIVLPYRSRKMNKSAYRRILWNATTPLIHYRSALISAAAVSTPASFAASTLQSVYADESAAGDSFLSAAGGLNNADTTVAPAFTGQNIVLRGGTFSLQLFNNVENGTLHGDSIVYNIALMRLSPLFVKATFDALTFIHSTTFEDISDFRSRFGTIVARRQGSLKAEDSVTIAYRNKIRRIDWGDYNIRKTGPSKFLWIILVGNGFDSAVQAARYKWSWNLSFTGDVTA